jgi:uncharacterized protein YjbJ (UPF0337 family)
MPWHWIRATQSIFGKGEKMNQNILEGKWMQLRGSIREKWGDLTDDEVDQIAGKRDRLAGVLQERYGYTELEAEREIDDFLDTWERDHPM